MRTICFLAALILFSMSTVNADIREAVDQIEKLNGQIELTAENTIKAIRFANGSALHADMLDLFAKQTDLELLHIANYRELNDAAVAKLAGLKKLKTLTLTNGSITDAAIKTIADAFPQLTNLDISYNSRLTDAAAREIAKLQQLETLNLLFCDFSEFGILNLVMLPKLRTLDIRGNMKIGNGGMEALAMLPALRSLKHRSPAVSDGGIRALTNAKALENLEIEDMSITGQAGESIRQMEKLTNLFIVRCENFDSEGVLALKGLKLNRLRFRGLPIGDSAMEVFQELPAIKRLELYELSSISDAGLANIAFLGNLEFLDIRDVPITSKSMEVIAKLPSLKRLELRSTKIDDEGLEALLAMPKLEAVTLEGNPGVTPAMIQKLRDAKQFIVLPEQR